MLTVAHVEVRYGQALAVSDVSLAIPEGSWVAVVGANGAGKSSLLRAIMGIVRHGGEVLFDGQDLSRLPPWERHRRGIGLVPEGRQLFGQMSVEDNLRAGGYSLPPAELQHGLDHAFGLFPRLAERRTQLASTLSGGEQQMLALARALMPKPRLLLVDEISWGLMPILVTQVFARLKELHRAGLTILQAEQNIREVLRYADHAYVMAAGVIAMEGKAAELARDERAGAADFEAVVRPDPALTANLLRVANSAYFGLRCRADSVRQAITLLGVKRVSDIAAAVALAPVIPRRLPGYEVDAGAFWLHSVAVAALSERLAAQTRRPCPELTFTAGLLHDMGKLAIGAFVGQASDAILSRVRGGLSFVSAEQAVLGVDHGQVGGLVAEAWSLPPAAAAAARWHHAPAEAPGDAQRPAVDLVHAADALAHALGFGTDAGELARAVDAGAHERLGFRPRDLESTAGESLDAIRDLATLFTPAGGHR
jgi:branched-chain amino acid transport system ATP-binding protein